MDVTESGMVTEARERQFMNALSPMDAAEQGMVMDARDEQL